MFVACAGGKRAKGRGGGGNRGVRGVDFGLGIGYSAETNNIPSAAAPSRSSAVNSLRTGVMAQFKSNFVAASSSTQNQGPSTNSGMQANNRMVLPGFVSGGSIGGDIKISAQMNSSSNVTSMSVRDAASQNGEKSSQTNSERLV